MRVISRCSVPRLATVPARDGAGSLEFWPLAFFLFLPDHDVHYNFSLLNFFLLTTIYSKTTHLLTMGNILPPTSLGDFTRMSHCLKLDLLCLISSLGFYGSGGLFPTKNIAAILIGIEL